MGGKSGRWGKGCWELDNMMEAWFLRWKSISLVVVEGRCTGSGKMLEGEISRWSFLLTFETDRAVLVEVELVDHVL